MSALDYRAVPRIAALDLSGSAGLYVKLGAENACSLATDGAIGAEDLDGVIVQGGGNASGGTVTVAVDGIVEAFAGATLTSGTHRLLTVDGTSRLVPAVAGKMVVAEWVGQFQGSGGAGKLTKVRLCKVPYVLDT